MQRDSEKSLINGRESEFSAAVEESRHMSLTPAESQRKHFSLLLEV